MRLAFAGAFAALAAISATPADALTVKPMDEVSPAGASTTFPGGEWGRGYAFQVDVPNVTLTQLGYATPNGGGAYEIALWDVASASKIAFVGGLSGTAGAWSFLGVTSVALTEGAECRVTLYGAGGRPTTTRQTQNTSQPATSTSSTCAAATAARPRPCRAYP